MESQANSLTTTTIFGAVIPEEESFDHKALSREANQAISALPAGSALLVVTRGPNAGARFLLKSPVVAVGRRADADIFLDDVTVSRKHAEFFLMEDGINYGVRDSGSLNGTYVNRERQDRIVLETGDEVQIGKYRMVYYSSPLNQ